MSQIIVDSSKPGAPEWLPETARRILLAGGSAADGLEGVAAVEVAELVARHRPRTLLVSTAGGSSGPDGVLGAEGRPGLGEIVAGLGRVGEIAQTPQGRSFIFIPSGQDPADIRQLCGSAGFRHLVNAAGRGGTILLHVVASDLTSLFQEVAANSGLDFDGLVLLGDTPTPRGIPPQVQLLARVETEPPAPAAPPGPGSSGGRGSGFTRPAGTPAIVAGSSAKRRPRGRLEKLLDLVQGRGTASAVGVAAVWLVAVLAVWLLWQGLSGWPAFEDDLETPIELPTERTPAGADTDADASSADDPADPAISADGAPAADDPAPTASGLAPGVDLPYSVLVASHVNYQDAAAERDQLAESDHLAFVAPTPVRGRLYYRVFAGALEDRAGASDLMRRLVASGDKRREREWDMRPVGLAFALGEFPSEEEAESQRRRLHESGVPAYVLSVGDTSGAIHRLYSGAFESEVAAGPTDSLLSAAGRDAPLVTRRGEPR